MSLALVIMLDPLRERIGFSEKHGPWNGTIKSAGSRATQEDRMMVAESLRAEILARPKRIA